MTASASSPAPRKPRRWLRILGLFTTLIVLIVVIAGAAGVFAVRSALPQLDGTIQAPGLNSAVTIIRDSNGVPHIQAQTDHDAFFAQGYVTAQDRLWQMEFNRRVASGTLSEVLGPATIDDDKFLRTLEFTRAAQIQFNNLSPTLVGELQAYTDGVNAFINTHKNNLPLEFRILGFSPKPWTPIDSISYGLVVALSLDNAFYYKIARMDALTQTSAAAVAQLFPAYPSTTPTLINSTGSNEITPGTSETKFSPQTPPTAALTLTAEQQTAAINFPVSLAGIFSQVRSFVGALGDVGSNDWVISGAHTTTGLPILANDPHLGINYPAIWYEIAIKSPSFNEIGFSFPGVPGVIIGHNDHIAWGVTDGMVDDTDLYIESLSADGSQYLYNGKYQPLTVYHETIQVAGQSSIPLTVMETNHGPILNSVYTPLQKNKTLLSLMWTALQPNYSFGGFFEIGAAQNIQQFQAALQDISISQNFVFADTLGNIGYRLSGELPIRPAANDLLPVDGTTSKYDWTGYVPFAQMPHLLNPPSGIILTANNQIVAPNYPYYVSDYFDAGYRALRIEQLLTAQQQYNVNDIEKIQNDITSIPAQEFTPFFVSAAQNASGNGPAAVKKYLTNWNGYMDRSSVAASIYEVTVSNLIQDLAQEAIHGAIYNEWINNQQPVTQMQFALNQIANPQAPFFTDASARDALIVKAENQAYTYLQTTFSTSDTTQWQWGNIHVAIFSDPLASVQALRPIFPYQVVTRPCDITCVDVGGDDGFTANDYTQHSLPSMRMIVDMSNMDNSVFVTTTGENGESFGEYNFNLLPLWNNGQYQPMDFTPNDVNKYAAHTVTLQP